MQRVLDQQNIIQTALNRWRQHEAPAPNCLQDLPQLTAKTQATHLEDNAVSTIQSSLPHNCADLASLAHHLTHLRKESTRDKGSRERCVSHSTHRARRGGTAEQRATR